MHAQYLADPEERLLERMDDPFFKGYTEKSCKRVDHPFEPESRPSMAGSEKTL
jgi:hypothetical protein